MEEESINALKRDEAMDLSQAARRVNNDRGLKDVTVESAAGSDEEPLLLRQTARVYRRRWLILGLTSLVTMSNATIWISLSAITDLVMLYYHERAIVVDWLSLTFIIVPALMSVPGTFIIARLGLKLSVALPAGFHAIGCSIRIAGIGRNCFAFVAIGQLIASFGTIFILAVPPQLAAVWFGERERTSATTIGVLANVFGVSLGFLLSTMLVPDTTNASEIGVGLQHLFVTHAVFCMLLFALVLVFVKDSPPSPPSLSEVLRESEGTVEPQVPFFISILFLLKNLHYMIITIAYSFNFAVVFALPTLLNQMVKVESTRQHYHMPEMSVGWVGFVGPLGGIIGSLVAGRTIDIFKVYKTVTCVCLFLATVSILGFAQSLFHSTNVYVIGVTFTLLCFLSFPYLSYGLDHLAEVSYPIPAGISATLPLLFGNLLCFVQIYIFQLLIDSGFVGLVLYLFLSIEGVAFLLSAFAKTSMNRQLADQVNTHLKS